MALHCNNVIKWVWEELLTQLHSSPLCFTLLRFFSQNLFRASMKRHNFCKYVRQKVITDIPKSENQPDWSKGIWCGSNCQKTNSTDVAEQIKPVYNTVVRRRTIWFPKIQTSVPTFSCKNKKLTSHSKKTQKRDSSWKRYTREHLPI